MSTTATTKIKTPTLDVADIKNGYHRDDYQGWGYLGERSDAPASRVAIADRAILRVANAKGWDAETLFHWLNSKQGRWFADAAFGQPRRSASALIAEHGRLFDNQHGNNGWDPR